VPLKELDAGVELPPPPPPQPTSAKVAVTINPKPSLVILCSTLPNRMMCCSPDFLKNNFGVADKKFHFLLATRRIPVEGRLLAI
jgi:hypothetical protein